MRLYDLIMQDKNIEDFTKEELDGITVISCDNVSTYFYQESDQEFWDMQDFPNIAPPFEKFWLDFKAPQYIESKERGRTEWKDPSPSHWGFLCYGIDLLTEEQKAVYLSTGKKEHRDYFKSVVGQARWGMDMYIFWMQAGIPFGPVWMWRFLIDDQGQVVRNAENESIVSTGAIGDEITEFIDEIAKRVGEQEAQIKVYHSVLPYWHCALLSLSFMHCKNVALHQITPPLKAVHNKAQKRRGVKPYQPTPYKVLDIYPMRETLKHEGQSATLGTKKALHICRGHFRDYSQGRGLFGKYKGTYWMPQHVRGQKEQGIATKDYNIKI